MRILKQTAAAMALRQSFIQPGTRKRSDGTSWAPAVLFFLFVATSADFARGAAIACLEEVAVKEPYVDAELIKELRELDYVPTTKPICMSAVLTGDIVKGDAGKVEDMVSSNSPFFGYLVLNSNGGNVSEAMELGRIARQDYLTTEAPSVLNGSRVLFLANKITDSPGAICASACFFAWIGGVTRIGSVIGIHRPFPPQSEMVNSSPGMAEQFYRDLSNKIRSYLIEMSVSPHWLDDMMRVSSDDIQMLTEEQVSELGGNLSTFDIPSFSQWKLAKCGGLSTDEWHDRISISLQKLNRTISADMSSYLARLDQKGLDADKCAKHAVIVARWRLHQ